MLVSFVIPVYNEAESLPQLARGIVEHVRPHDVELLFVDDGSTDDSLAVIRRAVLRLTDPPPVDLDSLRKETFDEWSAPIELRDAVDRLMAEAPGR